MLPAAAACRQLSILPATVLSHSRRGARSERSDICCCHSSFIDCLPSSHSKRIRTSPPARLLSSCFLI